MANIKGITIDIGGNTSKLENALKSVNKVIYSTNGELKDLNRALKLDPKSTELLSQKQDVLKQNIKATTERLNTLKDAQKQMGSYSNLTDEQKEKYRSLSVEITKGEHALKGMEAQLKSTASVNLDRLKTGLKNVGSIAGGVSKQVLKISGMVAGALAGAVAAGVKSYADYEQNLGGVETMFKDHADKVVQNAKNAYKTAGVSANEYMEGVTSFSASLLQSLGGDTSKAADVADMAFRDMSDNANKFGTDMGSIQNAYQGFAKQNYTMLDNLKLGYGGTKTEMQRLLKDAEKLTGQKYDINNLNDVYNAIHAVQEKLGVTGTTAEEAEKTISGSVNSMKAAFDNFLNGSGSPEALAETVTNVLKNVSDAIVKIAPGILSGLVQVFETLIPQVLKILIDLVPQLLDAVSGMIDAILNMVSGDTGKVVQVMATLINAIVSFLATNLPKIYEIVLKLILALAQGLAQSLPKLIPQIIQGVLQIIDVFLNNINLFIDAGIQLILGLADGILKALPLIISKLPEIITKIVEALIIAIPQLVTGAVQLVMGIVQNLPTIIMALINALPQIITAVVNGLINALPQLIQGLIQLVTMVVKNLPTIIMGLIKAAPQIIKALVTGLMTASGNLVRAGANLIKYLWNGFNSGVADFLVKVLKFAKNIPSKIKSGIGNIANVGSQLVQGIWSGIQNAKNWVLEKIKGFGKSILNGLKSFFGIHSPSRVMKDQVGKNIALGIGVGFKDEMKNVSKQMQNVTGNLADNVANELSFNSLYGDVDDAMKQLAYGINNSLNPMVNPNANELMLERQNNNNILDNKDNKESFTAIINNNSKYTSPAENIRLLRKEHELYKLKYGGG